MSTDETTQTRAPRSRRGGVMLALGVAASLAAVAAGAIGISQAMGHTSNKEIIQDTPVIAPSSTDAPSSGTPSPQPSDTPSPSSTAPSPSPSPSASDTGPVVPPPTVVDDDDDDDDDRDDDDHDDRDDDD